MHGVNAGMKAVHHIKMLQPRQHYINKEPPAVQIANGQANTQNGVKDNVHAWLFSGLLSLSRVAEQLPDAKDNVFQQIGVDTLYTSCTIEVTLIEINGDFDENTYHLCCVGGLGDFCVGNGF